MARTSDFATVPSGDSGLARHPGPAGFRSLLHPAASAGTEPYSEPAAAPEFFVDLNLDQVVAAIVATRAEYDLAPFFHAPAGNLETIRYRHDAMRDLQTPQVYEAVARFAATMRDVRDHLRRVDKLHYRHQKQSWLRDAIERYCEAVAGLAAEFQQLPLSSAGFRAFRQYLLDYSGSLQFTAMAQEARRIRESLDTVHYTMLFHGSSITVRKYADEYDYSEAVLATFEKFKQGAVKNYLVKFNVTVEMDHVEAAIVERVAALFPEVFVPLDRFAAANAQFIDDTLRRFDREVQFYMAYLDHLRGLERLGLPFCFPELSEDSGHLASVDGFDIALAQKLASENSTVVCNSFDLTAPERMFIVSGPNQGGKTTFARMFGQLHYIANLGLPVPGRQARLLLFDNLFTHFERQEHMESLRGKLEDELFRVHEIIRRATQRSVIVMNESFSSTALQDALFLGRRILEMISGIGAVGVYVTFIDELSRLNENTVSMVSEVVPGRPADRTFRVVRKPADGLAHAMSIAEKYRLTYASVKGRVAP
jgi:DNA mismatch repair protein MutS